MLALHLLDMEKLQDVPATYPLGKDTADKLQWMENLCNQIISFVWMPYDSREIQEAINVCMDEGESLPCVCLEGIYLQFKGNFGDNN